MPDNNKDNHIANLQNQISALPVGYISKKNIHGKECYYRQWKEDGKLKSKYVPSSEVDYTIQLIEERKKLQSELLLETSRANGDDYTHLFAYAKQFYLSRHVAIGVQSYEELITNKLFYIDKTDFISKWWDSRDEVTLITRPRRFGKTLNLRMVECFFSSKYANRSDLFDCFKVWKDHRFHELQGKFPVIFLSFGSVKMNTANGIIAQLANQISQLLFDFYYLEEKHLLTEAELEQYHKYQTTESYKDLIAAIPFLCSILYRIYNQKVIILLDEYDTPMLEAWNCGVWEECSAYIRNLMNAIFKSNPYMQKALLTGITRISKESFFSDLNNLKVCSLTSDDYSTSFGFTEDEVFSAMDAKNLKEKEKVKAWYNGFTIGHHTDIYNPWSIINYLRTHEFKPYWIHSASNQLINSLFQPGDGALKLALNDILSGHNILTPLREELTFHELSKHHESIWSLLHASGYLKVESTCDDDQYELAITNHEVNIMFLGLVNDWFSTRTNYNCFIKALLSDDVDFMIEYLNRTSEEVFSFYDTSGNEPERFYHGLVLGMILDLKDQYRIRSNRESGLGRFDVLLEPIQPDLYHAIILEFKVHRPRKEKDLVQTALTALQQIEDKNYAAELISHGILVDNIYKYGIAFKGKEIWIEGSH